MVERAIESEYAAALAAGGRLVSDRRAPAFWVLADPEDTAAVVDEAVELALGASSFSASIGSVASKLPAAIATSISGHTSGQATEATTVTISVNRIEVRNP